MHSRVLVIATSNVDSERIGPQLNEWIGEDAEVRVVASPSDLSRLDWLTNDEDAERAEARARAADLEAELATDEVDAGVGDSDPVQAVADALRTFRPDRVIFVTGPDDELGWLEDGAPETAKELFDLPVKHLIVR